MKRNGDFMTNNELLIAISDVIDRKFKEELTPLKDDVQTLKGDVQTLKGDVQTLKDDVCIMKGKIQILEEDMQSVKKEQKRINFIIENELRTNIKLLVENYLPAARRYEQSADTIEAIRMDMDVMKKILRKHTDELQKISWTAKYIF